MFSFQTQPPLGGKTPSIQTTNSPGDHLPLYPISDEELAMPSYMDALSEEESPSSHRSLGLYGNGGSSQDGILESPVSIYA